MSYPEAILLGLIQGLTEFLPISSSGHLVLGKTLLGVRQQGIVFEVVVHLATAGAVILAYRKRLRGIFQSLRPALGREFWKSNGPASGGPAVSRENFFLAVYLVAGTIPAGIAGVLLKDRVEAAFGSPRLICLMLMVTGLILLSSRFAPRNSRRPLGPWTAVLVGVAQAVALLPGISRSGSTITAGLLLGLAPERAAEFSFLLSLPAILGAAVLELAPHLGSGAPALPAAGALAAGFIAAFFSGLLAIFILLKILQKGRFDYFAYYCLAAGLAGYLLL